MKLSSVARTTILLTGLLAMATGASVVALVHSWKVTGTVDQMIAGNVREMLAANELEIQIQRQRNLLAAHLVAPGSRELIERLAEVEPRFRASLRLAQEETENATEGAILAKVGEKFGQYDSACDRVLNLSRQGKTNEAQRLYLSEVGRTYREIISLCEEVLADNESDIERAVIKSRTELHRLTLFLGVTILSGLLMAVALLWTLLKGVFSPIRMMERRAQRLFKETVPEKEIPFDDPLERLGFYLQVLMTDLPGSRPSDRNKEPSARQMENLASIGKVVAQIVHEIRNRIVMVGALARSVGKASADNNAVQTKSEVMYQEVCKLENLLGDIMGISKPMALETVPCSLNTVVENLLDRVREQIPQTVSIEAILSPEIPDVRIDVERIEQVILNLIRNAIEAMEKGGTIRVSTRPCRTGVTLAVKDEGSGIPEEIQTVVFDPFFTTKPKGTGLGLAICGQIIRHHGGVMRIRSSSATGTCVAVDLPSGAGGP